MRDITKYIRSGKLLLVLVYVLLLSVTARAQIIGPVPEGQQNSIFQNSVSNIAAYGDTVWIGPLLQRHIGVEPDWYTADKADSIIKGRGRVYSLALGQDTVVTGIGYSKKVKGEDIDTGIGFYFSTDGGNNWRFENIPLDALNDSTFTYGNNNLKKLPVVVPEESIAYNVDFKNNTVFAAAWALGIIRSQDFGKTWERLLLPPSDVDTLRPENSYNFKYDPLSDNNFLGFGVFIASNNYVWAGTADGVDISPNALTAPADSVIWYHKTADQSVNGLLGNWVVKIKEQPGTGAVWMTNWVTGSTDQYGLVSSDDNGKTFKHYLVGVKIYDITFDQNTIYAVGDDGLYISDDNGATWNHINQIKSANTFIKPNSSYYCLANSNGVIWVGSSDGLASTSDHGKTWSITRVNFPLHGGNRFQPNAPNVDAYAYPNPFSISQHREVRIKFDVKKSGNVSIKLYDFGMNLIKVLDNEYLNSGPHEAVWNGRNAHGDRVANGVVFYRINTPGHDFGGKILVMQ